ncbi:hypothetical protein F511_17731 [Dorcoceras hygrometricum]|uniref:Dystroglycan-like n=1 Tax=Dorcoceras hygrometricum TaxID=472368 RepID=A0A2Z7AYK9_9LAMI|nr:hypothetical protein F511_17731 [Dorcoceras hygrometricum]
MASSLISNSHHIDFDAVFEMKDTDLVQMFESLIATGLKNFLGCPAVFNEDALTEFFANSSVREDGLVVSTVNGVSVEISEEVFAATFELPVEGLTDLSDVPKNLVFDARSLFSISKEQVAPIVKKKRTTKAKPVAAKRLSVEEPVGVSTKSEQPVAEVATGERDPVGGLRIASITEAKTGDADAAIEQVLAQLDLVIQDSDVERSDRIETWFDKAFDEEFETANQENQDSEVEIDFDVDNQELPVFDETKNVPEAGGSKGFGVDKAGEKAIGSTHSTEEHMSIDDLLMQISEDMMLPSVTAAEITKIRLGDSLNIHEPWTATASKIIDLLSVAHSKSLEDLIAQQKEQGIPIEQPCTSTLLDTSVGSGAVLAQYYSMAKSTCWVRPLVLIDGMWTPIQGNDFLRSSCKLSLFVNRKKLPKSVVEEEFVPHCYLIEPVQYWGAAPSLIKTWGWARVCTEIIRYSMFGCLRPVCREIVVYNLGVERITDYLLSDFQRVQESSSSSSDSQMNFDTTDFPLDDTTEAQTSLPAATVEAIDDLRAFLLHRIDDSNSAILSKLHTLERGLRNAMHDQDDNARKLINSVCQDAHTIGDVQKIHLNDVKKIVLAQGVTAGADSLEIRKAINAIDAKILLLDGQVATIRSEHLEFQARISADLLSLSTQIGDLVAYIHSGDAKKGEGSSSRRPLPTPVHHSEGTGDAVRLMEPTQADIDNANRAILERMRNEDSLRAERERDRSRRERRLSRSGAYKRRRDDDNSNLLNQSQDRALEPDARISNPDASYSDLEIVSSYSGLQNQTQELVIQTQATVL